MDHVVSSMYREKLKEAQAKVGINNASQKCDCKEYQENVSFVACFEAMAALHFRF
jgi:hypothetical protein